MTNLANLVIIAAIIAAISVIGIAGYTAVAIITEKVIRRSGKTIKQILEDW